MRRKLLYLALFLFILGGILGPSLYAKIVHPPETGSSTVSLPVAEGEKARSVAPRAENRGGEALGGGSFAPEPAPKSAAATAVAEEKQGAPKAGDAPEENPQGATAAQKVTRQDEGPAVWIAVVGKSGELLFPPSQVRVKREGRWGLTALGALEATGLPYTTKPTWPDFVESIAGQANYQLSGWMYAVNGEVPMHMASKHPVKDGDRVIWWYSTSMDKPPPRWEDLVVGR